MTDSLGEIDVGYDRSVLQNWGLGFGVWGLGLGFGVWGLGFGVWGLGFGKKKGTLGQIGVWGLGL